jgi:ribonuclease R
MAKISAIWHQIVKTKNMSKQKKSAKKLPAQLLQIEILRYLLSFPHKRLTARQLIQSIPVDNNRDSVEHALEKLREAGSVEYFEGDKYGVALQKLTRTDPFEAPVNITLADPLDEVEVPESAFLPKNKKNRDPRQMQADQKLAKQANQAKQAQTRQARPVGKTIEGRVDMTRSGTAYIVSELQDSDVFVSARHLNGALHGDIVRVSLFAADRRRNSSATQRRPEGQVISVVKRAHEIFMGTLHRHLRYAIVTPENTAMATDIFVPLEASADAQDGDKVVVRVTDWREGTTHAPIGKVTQVLGAVGGNNFEMQKILINAGFELSHSEEVMAEAEAIPVRIPEMEIAMRRDFRTVLTFTIDPEDAKDFDDAISFQVLENGHTEVGVHIADVTHYLKPDTPMDQEAYRRSTSVYLVDRCNPMLPEKLSNNLCSLVPHQDRLTFSAVFEFDAKDKIVRRWFGKTVIHSAHRFTYEAAQTILEKKPTADLKALPIFPQLQEALMTVQRMAKKMRKERERQGAISFDTEEVRFRLDADGTPLEAYVKERKDAHLLIEDFMLLANKEVALFVDGKSQAQQEVPFVYRIHDLPDLDKVADFARFAAELGHPLHVDTPQQIAKAYNDLLKAAQKDERLKLLEPLAIRTMAKAVYSTNNIGHYGLGFSHYSHFTSPIRRYADVLTHRILSRNLDGQTYRTDKTSLEEKCKYISAQEKKAADAERESIKYKQAEFISRHIGETFEGIISGFLERGFFVELPGSKAEGLVEFKYLQDSYTVEEGNLRAHGRRYGQSFKMGDRVQVRVAEVDLQRRQIELELANSE